MTQRITVTHLKAKVSTVNRMLGYGEDPAYSTDGAIVLAGAYGGRAVHQYSGPHGGVRDLTGGYVTARECSVFLSGMIAALRIVAEEK